MSAQVKQTLANETLHISELTDAHLLEIANQNGMDALADHLNNIEPQAGAIDLVLAEAAANNNIIELFINTQAPLLISAGFMIGLSLVVYSAFRILNLRFQ